MNDEKDTMEIIHRLKTLEKYNHLECDLLKKLTEGTIAIFLVTMMASALVGYFLRMVIE